MADENPEEMAVGIIGMPKKKAQAKPQPPQSDQPEQYVNLIAQEAQKPQIIPGGINGVIGRAKRALFGAPKPQVQYNLQQGILTPKGKMQTAMDLEVARIQSARQAQALAEAEQAYQQMRYVPSMAQPRMKQISGQIQKFRQQMRQPDIYQRAATYGAQRMESAAQGISRMPQRFAGSFQGARRYEKGLSNAKSLGTGIAGFLFPQTGLQRRLKGTGYKRGSAGRPRGVYTHIIPGVGPVHVYVWRKWMRAQKRRAQEAIQMRENAMAQQLAKKGLPLDLAYAQAEQYQQMRRQAAQEAAPELAEEVVRSMGVDKRGPLMSQYYEMPPQQYQYQPMPQTMQPQAYNQARAPINQMSVIGQQSRAAINMLGPDRLSNIFTQNQQSQPAPPGMTERYDVFSGRKTFVPKNEPTERWARDNTGWARPGMIGVRRANQNIMSMQGGMYYQ